MDEGQLSDACRPLLIAQCVIGPHVIPPHLIPPHLIPPLVIPPHVSAPYDYRLHEYRPRYRPRKDRSREYRPREYRPREDPLPGVSAPRPRQRKRIASRGPLTADTPHEYPPQALPPYEFSPHAPPSQSHRRARAADAEKKEEQGIAQATAQSPGMARAADRSRACRPGGSPEGKLAKTYS